MKIEKEYIKCNLCGSDDSEVVYEDRLKRNNPKKLSIVYKSSGSDIATDRIVKCKKCGLIYVNPRIKGELILQGYSEGCDETFVSQAKGRELTFEKSLKLIEKHTPIKGRILDIGTAGGSFLHIAKEHGWKVWGIEPNKWLCNWGKKNYKINIKPGTLFDYKFKNNTFDVITLLDVLEHVENPKKLLKECNRILKKDGLLVTNYPNISSSIAKMMGERWVFLLSVHLFYFTPNTISKMLKETGFAPFLSKKHFQTLSFGYLVYRIKPYSRLLHSIGKKFTRITYIKNIQIPYWLGQTLVLARKK